ncbi:MAG: hypothetical protein WAM91_08185 [Candidatus Acidiferrales bacterium]
MTKLNLRHHQSHPVSAVRPNADINKKPNYTPPERAANVNPSLPGPVGVDAVNARRPAPASPTALRQGDDNCDAEIDDDCDEEPEMDLGLDPQDRRK